MLRWLPCGRTRPDVPSHRGDDRRWHTHAYSDGHAKSQCDGNADFDGNTEPDSDRNPEPVTDGNPDTGIVCTV